MRNFIYFFVLLTVACANTDTDENVASKHSPFIQEVVDKTYLLEGWLARLKELDAQDIPLASFVEETEAAYAEFQLAYEIVAKSDVKDSSSLEIKAACLNLFQDIYKLMSIYKENAKQLSVPDSEWEEGMLEEWILTFDTFYAVYYKDRGEFQRKIQEIIEVNRLAQMGLNDL